MANVTFTPNHQPLPACYPTDVNGLLDLISTGGGLNGTIPDTSGGGVFVGSTPPSSALTNKVWYKTDAAGRPLGVFMFYNGNWRKVYTGVGLGQISMYAGSNAVFDGTGLGLISGDFDGWALCNGNNGTPDMRDRYVVSANSYSGGWGTNVDGVAFRTTGGAAGQVTIQGANLPQLHVQVFSVFNGIVTSTGSGRYIGGTADQGINIWPVIETINSPNAPLPLPAFYALAFMMFVGYQ
jgi:hypothetical protein